MLHDFNIALAQHQVMLQQNTPISNIPQRHCYELFCCNVKNMMALTDMVFDHISNNQFVDAQEKRFYEHIAAIYQAHKHPTQQFLQLTNWDGEGQKEFLEEIMK